MVDALDSAAGVELGLSHHLHTSLSRIGRGRSHGLLIPPQFCYAEGTQKQDLMQLCQAMVSSNGAGVRSNGKEVS
jgi:hypothetical protein